MVSLISVIIIFVSDIIIVNDEKYLIRKDINRKNSYLLELIIPKIDFNMKIYDINSESNNVDYNVEILNSSDLMKNVYYFAGHSGNGDNCYFNKIKELCIGDNIFVKLHNEVLIYEVVNVYNIFKNGYMEVNEYEESVLYLITCANYNRQLIVKGVLIN